MKNTIICIVTSERTYQKLGKYLFNPLFIAKRGFFDLAVVMNGYDSLAADFVKKYNPEIFIQRENAGFEPAALTELLKVLPLYDTTLFLHDDHHFSDANWYEKIISLRNSYPNVDVMGNVLYQDPLSDYEDYCSKVGATQFANSKTVGFLHGLSGVFNSKAIEVLKSTGVPHKPELGKYGAYLGEYLFSNILQHHNLNVAQLPPGVFLFLHHGDNNDINHLASKANMHYHLKEFDEAMKYYNQFIAQSEKEGIPIPWYDLYTNFGNICYYQRDFLKAKDYFERVIDIRPDDDYARKMLSDIQLLLNPPF